MVGRHHRLRRRIGRHDHRSIVRLVLIITRRKLHMTIRWIPRRKLLRRICWGHVPVHAVHTIHTIHVWRVSHVRWGAHIRMARVVREVLLPPRLWHGRLPMGHRRQVVVHLDWSWRWGSPLFSHALPQRQPCAMKFKMIQKPKASS